MSRIPVTLALAAALLLTTAAGGSEAQTTVTLPDTSQTTAVTVNMLEQAVVTIPASAGFTVANITTSTPAPALTISVGSLTRRSTSNGVSLSLRANTSLFAPPQPGAPTWSASDVSWAAANWTGGSGVAGTLSSSGFSTVATCGIDGCSTSGLVLTLAPKPTVTRSGAHTLVVTWKIESLQ